MLHISPGPISCSRDVAFGSVDGIAVASNERCNPPASATSLFLLHRQTSPICTLPFITMGIQFALTLCVRLGPRSVGHHSLAAALAIQPSRSYARVTHFCAAIDALVRLTPNWHRRLTQRSKSAVNVKHCRRISFKAIDIERGCRLKMIHQCSVLKRNQSRQSRRRTHLQRPSLND
jgi:hypothetical protein